MYKLEGMTVPVLKGSCVPDSGTPNLLETGGLDVIVPLAHRE